MGTKVNNPASQHNSTVPVNQNIGGSVKTGGTIISGHEDDQKSDNPENLNTLLGFLVSFSRTDSGEYWVLREGNNFIGKEADSTVKLNEDTVSGKHATLNITRNAEENKYDIVLVDTASTNGTFINGKKILAYNGKIVSNNDKIKIGNYELKLIIIDKYLENLTKSEYFKEVIDYDYSSRDFYAGGTAAKYNT